MSIYNAKDCPDVCISPVGALNTLEFYEPIAQELASTIVLLNESRLSAEQGEYLSAFGFFTLASIDLTPGGKAGAGQVVKKVTARAGDSIVTIPKGSGVATGTGAFSNVAPATAKQLQKKFKHAGDFGVSGNYNSANALKFNQAIQKHLNSSETKQISGIYRGSPVTFYTNPNSGLTVLQKPNGSFLSGWKLNPQQLHHVLKDGKL